VNEVNYGLQFVLETVLGTKWTPDIIKSNFCVCCVHFTTYY